jgi:hypothetical protein
MMPVRGASAVVRGSYIYANFSLSCFGNAEALLILPDRFFRPPRRQIGPESHAIAEIASCLSQFRQPSDRGEGTIPLRQLVGTNFDIP